MHIHKKILLILLSMSLHGAIIGMKLPCGLQIPIKEGQCVPTESEEAGYHEGYLIAIGIMLADNVQTYQAFINIFGEKRNPRLMENLGYWLRAKRGNLSIDEWKTFIEELTGPFLCTCYDTKRNIAVRE